MHLLPFLQVAAAIQANTLADPFDTIYGMYEIHSVIPHAHGIENVMYATATLRLTSQNWDRRVGLAVAMTLCATPKGGYMSRSTFPFETYYSREPRMGRIRCSPGLDAMRSRKYIL